MNKLACNFVCAVGLGLTLSAEAQRHETFAHHPEKRQEVVKRLSERSKRDKEQARIWAQQHGVPMRQQDAYNVRELMAVRDGRPIYYSTLNVNAAISTAANLVRGPSPYDVTGQNVTVGIWDGGMVMTNHQEFGSRVLDKDAGIYVTHAHSTHVGGTIGAAGIDPNAKGMAPDVHIDSYEWNGDIYEMAAVAASVAGESDMIYLSNHSYTTQQGGWAGIVWYGTSWGSNAVDEVFGRYSAKSEQWDEIIYDAPYYLPFVAAGNERNDNPFNGEGVYYRNGGAYDYFTYDSATCPPGDGIYKSGYDTICNESALAKNVMTVGAVQYAVAGGSRSLVNADMTIFSSWGPADDGRIKPDIVANGYQLYSCIDSSNAMSYATMSGTSMASPNACGSAALLVDYYSQRFPGQAMKASTLKGLIIHTADDLGNPGPDYSYGWGLMNTVAAAELINDYANGNTLRLIEGTITTNDWYQIFDLSKQGIDPIRVTLCWTDPPGNPQSGNDDRTPVLVNDLDLEVWGPTVTHYPYSLDYDHPTASATTNGANHIDNVEQVYIEHPVPGASYTIAVIVPGALVDGEQDFSLLISGTDNDADSDGMTDDWELANFLTATGAVSTADADGDGEDNGSEYISGHDPNDAASFFQVNSWQAGPASGVPFVVNWESLPGRNYSVMWSSNLISDPFSDISGSLVYPANSYTDSVIRAGAQQYYRVGVQLAP